MCARSLSTTVRMMMGAEHLQKLWMHFALNSLQTFPQGSSLFPAVRPLAGTFSAANAHQETSAFTAEQHALLEQAGRIFSAIGPTASPASAAEFVTYSLSTRLPEFIYDPDNGCTFDVWINQYEDIIVQDGSTLDEAAKARLIVSKLDAAAYARFTNHILPKRPSELCFDDTIKTLKELSGHNTSVFARRYNYLRTQRNCESLSDYTGLVNRRHEMAEFNAITPEQIKCLVWICGLHIPDYAAIRTRAARMMEDNPQTTLKQLSLAIQQFLNIRRDAELLGSPPSLLQPEVNAIATKKNCTQNPPSPCFR
ncbi:unnamed protein product [Toxocara canis]|uniref:DUF7083 domain-containing protein n=1 Tax=Toxocara canis TaxID=6265 RepID=A0A183TYD5_TOXCA|nr:unnamed protein product [Toxocara canis]